MSADGQVKSLIDRVLRLKEEQDALAADIREVYAEAKANGYDKTALGEVVAYLRKIEKKGKDACEERDAAFGLYLDAYERAASHAYASAPEREIIEKFDAETGEITEHEQPETADEQPEAHGSSPCIGAREADRPATYGQLVTAGETAPHSPSAAPPADAVAVAPQASQAATAAIPEGIPAFLLKERKPLRPNCLSPENCAGYGSHTCHRCTRAMAESEAA